MFLMLNWPGRCSRIGLAAFALVLAALGSSESVAQQSGNANAGHATDLYGDSLPSGAVARLGTVRYTHARETRGTYVLPDNTTAVTSRGNAIRFWNARDGKLLREFLTVPLNVSQFAVSRDGTKVAIAGFWHPDDASLTQGEIRVLDAATGEHLQVFKRDARDVDRPALAFTPDGKLLASLGMMGLLRVEEVSSGAELLTETFPKDNSPSLAIAPDGKTITIQTGGSTEKFYRWKWQSGEEPQALKTIGTPNGGGPIVFSPDSRQICWINHDPGHVWDAETGALVVLLTPPSAEEFFLGGFVYGPDGKQLFASVRERMGWRGRIIAWDTATWKPVKSIPGEAAWPAISQDGRLLISGNWVWDLEEGRELSSSQAAHRGTIVQVEVPRPDTAITASDDGSIRVWDSATGRQRRKLDHDSWVRAIAISPDGQYLASSSLDDTVRLWELETGREIYRLPGHGALGGRRALAFTKDGQRLCSFGDDFYLRLFDVRNGKAVEEWKIRPSGIAVPEDDAVIDALEGPYIEQFALSPDGVTLVVCASGKIFLFDVASGKERKILDHDGGTIISIAFSPDGQRLLICSWSKSVSIKLPDGGTRFSAARHHTAAVWHLESGKPETTVLLPEGAVGPGAFSPDGSRFAVASGRQASKVTVFGINGEPIGMLPGVPERISGLAFSHSGLSLVTAFSDSTALVWGPDAIRDVPMR